MENVKNQSVKKKPWKNSIVGHAEVDPKELVPNPENWRTHPEFQNKVLNDTLAEVGWIQQVIVNKTSGKIVDGHLRVALALQRGEEKVPVVYVQLTEEEERKALATLDPMSELAGGDIDKFTELTQDMDTDSLWIRELLRGTANKIVDGAEDKETDGEEEREYDAEIPEMELAPFERYDYIVLMFRNDQDFSGVCEKMGIGKASMPLPDGGRKIGLGRVIDGAAAIERLEEQFNKDASRNSKQGAT